MEDTGASVEETTRLDSGDDEGELDFVEEEEVGPSLGCVELEDGVSLDAGSEEDAGVDAGVEETVWDSDTETGEDWTTEGEDTGFEEDVVGLIWEDDTEDEEVVATLETCETLEEGEGTGVEQETCSEDTVGAFPAWPASNKRLKREHC